MRTIIFVCHGCICRSPAAECIMQQALKERGLDKECRVYSRATSYEEIGNDIYPPMRQALSAAGVPIHPHAAYRLTASEYEDADLIFYMDAKNRGYLNDIHEDEDDKYRPITTYCPHFGEIEDPWYTDRFDWVVRQLKDCVNAILDHWDELFEE